MNCFRGFKLLGRCEQMGITCHLSILTGNQSSDLLTKNQQAGWKAISVADHCLECRGPGFTPQHGKQTNKKKQKNPSI